MDSKSYDPKTDFRGCILARYDPLESITNPDVDGIIVSVACEPWPHLLLGHELTDSSRGSHPLSAWVQVFNWISQWIKD